MCSRAGVATAWPFEIETGKSDPVWNEKQDLLAGFQRVVVVATDERALQKVEPWLALVGLIIPNRVQIVLGEAFARNA